MPDRQSNVFIALGGLAGLVRKLLKSFCGLHYNG